MDGWMGERESEREYVCVYFLSYVTYCHNKIHVFISLNCSFLISIFTSYSLFLVSVPKSVLILWSPHHFSACLSCLSHGTLNNVGTQVQWCYVSHCYWNHSSHMDPSCCNNTCLWRAYCKRLIYCMMVNLVIYTLLLKFLKVKVMLFPCQMP